MLSSPRAGGGVIGNLNGTHLQLRVSSLRRRDLARRRRLTTGILWRLARAGFPPAGRAALGWAHPILVSDARAPALQTILAFITRDRTENGPCVLLSPPHLTHRNGSSAPLPDREHPGRMAYRRLHGLSPSHGQRRSLSSLYVVSARIPGHKPSAFRPGAGPERVNAALQLRK